MTDGPDVMAGHPGVIWVYVIGSPVGAGVAVALDRVLRGGATEEQAAIAESEPEP